LDVNSMSAVEGTDFTVTKTITVPEGPYNLTSDSFPVAFNVLDDNFKEYNEDVNFTIQSVTNGATVSGGCGGSAIATYTIVDDDVFDAGPDQLVCPGDTIELTATGSLDPKWKKGIKQGVPFKAPLLAGVYTYTAYDTVNIDYANNLLQNFDFSAGNTGFTTQYWYDPRIDGTFNSTYLQSGSYNVARSSRVTNKAFVDMADHSGTNPSRMLVVNASGFPNLTFWSQTVAVKPNTDYVFSFWVTAVTTASAPQIRFSINGVPLSTTTLPLTPGWIQLTEKWNSGASTSAIIRGVDLNITAASNDFAMDDMYFGEVASFTDSLKVTVKSAPKPIVKDVDTCQQLGTYTLTALGTSLKWYNDTLSTTVGSSTAPTINLNSPDTTTKWVTQMVNGCESQKAEMKVAIRALPSAPVIRSLDTCQTTGTYSLKATGTNLKWYSVATGGIAKTITPTLSLNIPDTTNYWVSQTLNGCEGPRAPLLFQVNPTPSAPIVRDTVNCQQLGNYTLTAIGTGLKWYNDSLPTSAGSSTAPIINLNIPDTLNKWVSQSLNGCESKKAEIKVAIKALPVAPIVHNLDTCQTTGTYSLQATGTSLKWYSAATGGVAKTVPPTYPLNVPDTLSQWVSQTLNGCEGPRASLLFRVNPTPISHLVLDTMICQQVGT